MNKHLTDSNKTWRIRPASANDLEELTLLTYRSKAYWGYSKIQMEQWKEELTVDETYLDQHHVYVLMSNAGYTGYYSLLKAKGPLLKLDNFFIEPSKIGKGWGHLLLKDLFNRGKKEGYESIELLADPNATEFYLKHGFKKYGAVQSSIPGRSLPRMRFNLKIWKPIR